MVEFERLPDQLDKALNDLKTCLSEEHAEIQRKLQEIAVEFRAAVEAICSHDGNFLMASDDDSDKHAHSENRDPLGDQRDESEESEESEDIFATTTNKKLQKNDTEETLPYTQDDGDEFDNEDGRNYDEKLILSRDEEGEQCKEVVISDNDTSSSMIFAEHNPHEAMTDEDDFTQKVENEVRN
jgi:hypothetical protein